MKKTLFVRNLRIAPELLEALDANVLTFEDKVAPGQIRKRGEWYVLTYLRTVKIKQYVPAIDNNKESDIDTIRSVSFRIINNRLMVDGGKADIKEIMGLFEAYAVPLAGAENQLVDFDKYYRIEVPEVDLSNILKIFEERGTIAAINKIRVKPMDVTLGRVHNCIVNTDDYGGVRKTLEQDDNNIFGMALVLKEPDKTTIYYDLDGQVRVQSKDVDLTVLEQFLIDNATLI